MKKQNRMESIVQFLNFISDQEAGWFPFPFLRPEMNEKICFNKLSRIAFYFGLSYGLICALAYTFINKSFDGVDFALITIAFVPLCFISYGTLVAWPWNTRVRANSRDNTAWYDRAS